MTLGSILMLLKAVQSNRCILEIFPIWSSDKNQQKLPYSSVVNNWLSVHDDVRILTLQWFGEE